MLWVIMGLVVALSCFLLLVGLLLPHREQVTRVALFKAPLAEVWDALNNLPNQTQWRSGLKSVQILDDDDGLRWLERDEQGKVQVLRKIKEIQQQELVLEIHRSGSKTIRQARLSSVPGGTRVTFTETLEAKMPTQRLLNRMRGGVDRQLDGFISQLRGRFPA